MSMNHARTAIDSSERLSWEEICKRFPDAWVVIAGADWTNETDFEFATAEVLGHHARRRDASPGVKAARAAGREVGCFWTGALRGPIPRLAP